MKQISSIQNAGIREIVGLLSKSRARRKSGLFVTEGLNETRLCLEAGYRIREIYFCPDYISVNELSQNWNIPMDDDRFTMVTPEVFSRISYREDVKNAVALVEDKIWSLSEADFQKDWGTSPLFLVAESVEKPGNLGALLRTADAAGISAVLLADPLCDLYNPNVIRSSVGCVFTIPVRAGTSAQVQLFLKEKNVNVFTTFMDQANSVWNADLTGPVALVVGTEHAGLSQEWQKPGFTNVQIPMFGKVDSMNVSVAASLLMYESVRQRKAEKQF